MLTRKSHQEIIYRIRLKGVIGHPAVDWVGDISIFPQNDDETLLVGAFADQAALRGFLDQLWNLNFTILSVESVKNENDPNSIP